MSGLGLLHRFDLRDHILGVGPAAAEHLLQHVAAAARDHLAVDQHVELAELADLAFDGEAEGVLDFRSETRCAWAEASGLAVLDDDFHVGRCIGHR